MLKNKVQIKNPKSGMYKIIDVQSGLLLYESKHPVEGIKILKVKV